MISQPISKPMTAILDGDIFSRNATNSSVQHNNLASVNQSAFYKNEPKYRYLRNTTEYEAIDVLKDNLFQKPIWFYAYDELFTLLPLEMFQVAHTTFLDFSSDSDPFGKDLFDDLLFDAQDSDFTSYGYYSGEFHLAEIDIPFSELIEFEKNFSQNLDSEFDKRVKNQTYRKANYLSLLYLEGHPNNHLSHKDNVLSALDKKFANEKFQVTNDPIHDQLHPFTTEARFYCKAEDYYRRKSHNSTSEDEELIPEITEIFPVNSTSLLVWVSVPQLCNVTGFKPLPSKSQAIYSSWFPIVQSLESFDKALQDRWGKWNSCNTKTMQGELLILNTMLDIIDEEKKEMKATKNSKSASNSFYLKTINEFFGFIHRLIQFIWNVVSGFFKRLYHKSSSKIKESFHTVSANVTDSMIENEFFTRIESNAVKLALRDVLLDRKFIAKSDEIAMLFLAEKDFFESNASQELQIVNKSANLNDTKLSSNSTRPPQCSEDDGLFSNNSSYQSGASNLLTSLLSLLPTPPAYFRQPRNHFTRPQTFDTHSIRSNRTISLNTSKEEKEDINAKEKQSEGNQEKEEKKEETKENEKEEKEDKESQEEEESKKELLDKLQKILDSSFSDIFSTSNFSILYPHHDPSYHFTLKQRRPPDDPLLWTEADFLGDLNFLSLGRYKDQFATYRYRNGEFIRTCRIDNISLGYFSGWGEETRVGDVLNNQRKQKLKEENHIEKNDDAEIESSDTDSSVSPSFLSFLPSKFNRPYFSLYFTQNSTVYPVMFKVRAKILPLVTEMRIYCDPTANLPIIERVNEIGAFNFVADVSTNKICGHSKYSQKSQIRPKKSAAVICHPTDEANNENNANISQHLNHGERNIFSLIKEASKHLHYSSKRNIIQQETAKNNKSPDGNSSDIHFKFMLRDYFDALNAAQETSFEPIPFDIKDDMLVFHITIGNTKLDIPLEKPIDFHLYFDQ
ncbi:uncharacterized protein MONOS_10378 [Monocercomonoides exilis]|uniref:uncharacterized protein n=1 Tax=Monocercomonoides exilis TaxID=2049356 RepID=UPI00355A4D82|nr:hypothetical protein MONOS_10378 [Monocercomonoides exilis]|eukprot:MONOS_10378.1-p1 / transcript=MONOS_10378.1 / gene=MONOS_10378 / organism=Monocercomonoides_exilis_PA203 / gene_product=unspecified product / transcript_product=unspecified product / location=Mono_scaffold00469:29958-33077(+) / protein_length=961 / sequence_SO=supercontig / SO=protein_coding / is_pseudo=false